MEGGMGLRGGKGGNGRRGGEEGRGGEGKERRGGEGKGASYSHNTGRRLTLQHWNRKER